ncbi:MAG: hypothetical protein ACXWFC_00400 [Nitrososphaeraceae archaeon]
MLAEKAIHVMKRMIYNIPNVSVIPEKSGIVKIKKRKSSTTLYLSFNINESLNIDNTEIYFESILLKNI